MHREPQKRDVASGRLGKKSKNLKGSKDLDKKQPFLSVSFRETLLIEKKRSGTLSGIARTSRVGESFLFLTRRRRRDSFLQLHPTAIRGRLEDAPYKEVQGTSKKLKKRVDWTGKQDGQEDTGRQWRPK